MRTFGIIITVLSFIIVLGAKDVHFEDYGEGGIFQFRLNGWYDSLIRRWRRWK